MAASDSSRTWVPQELVDLYQEHAARYRQLAPLDFDSEAAKTLAQHECIMDHECISLYAGTNIMNPPATRLLSSSVGSCPILGNAGDKYGTDLCYAEHIEIMTVEILKRIFKCRYVEFRAGSGSQAM